MIELLAVTCIPALFGFIVGMFVCEHLNIVHNKRLEQARKDLDTWNNEISQVVVDEWRGL